MALPSLIHDWTWVLPRVTLYISHGGSTMTPPMGRNGAQVATGKSAGKRISPMAMHPSCCTGTVHRAVGHRLRLLLASRHLCEDWAGRMLYRRPLHYLDATSVSCVDIQHRPPGPPPRWHRKPCRSSHLATAPTTNRRTADSPLAYTQQDSYRHQAKLGVWPTLGHRLLPPTLVRKLIGGPLILPCLHGKFVGQFGLVCAPFD